MPETFRENSTCVVCCAFGDTKKCGKCRSVTYCGLECQRKDWSRHKRLCAPAVIKELEGKGRGLMASRSIEKGELIVKDKAVINLCDGIYEDFRPVLQSKVDNLTEIEKEEFYRLTRKKSYFDSMEAFESKAEAEGDEDTKRKIFEGKKYIDVVSIFHNNSIGDKKDGSSCLYLTLSLLNHSCAPNTSWSSIPKGGNGEVMELRAIRNINEGEELTVNYINKDGSYSKTEERQQMLIGRWDFTCQCRLCVTGDEDEIKLKISAAKDEMRKIGDLQTIPLDKIDWTKLAEYQCEIVDLVKSLSSDPPLLTECLSLANLAQLSRNLDLLHKACNLSKEVAEESKFKADMESHDILKENFGLWMPNLHQLYTVNALKPNEKEIMSLLKCRRFLF